MRRLFAVLVLANLALAAYALLAPSKPGSEAELPNAQIRADEIRIVPPRPAVPVSRRSACIEWGPFSAAELPAAQSAVDALGLGDRIGAMQVQAVASWWVFIPPLDSEAQVERKISELEDLGVTEYYAVESAGDMRNAISLGIFRTEEAANNFLAELQAKGIHSARVGERERRVSQTAFVSRNPDAQISARMAELASRFAGSELKATDCPPLGEALPAGESR